MIGKSLACRSLFAFALMLIDHPISFSARWSTVKAKDGIRHIHTSGIAITIKHICSMLYILISKKNSWSFMHSIIHSIVFFF